MLNKRQTLIHVGLIACFAVLAMSPSYYNGITLGPDSPQHFQFAQTVHNSIHSGEIYPSFAALPNQGYGDVGLRFYPPLVYYLLSLLFLIIENWYWAGLIAFTLIFFLSGFGTYFWAREELPAAESLFAAALYIFAPQHLNQIYNSFLLAEFAASAIIPFCFLFLTRVCRKGNPLDILGLSIAYALLVLTHLPMIIIGSIAFTVYALFLLNRRSFLQTTLKLAAAVAGALLASSFYWLRMTTELNWVNHSTKNYFSDAYDYRQNFLFTLANIINFKTDVSVLWLADLMLLAVLLVSIPSTVYFYRERKNLSAFTKAVALVFLVSVFLTTSFSAFVWDNFTILQKVQFPWRWLGIVSMSGAVFASSGIIKAAEKMKQSKNLLLPVGLGIILLCFFTVSAVIIKGAIFVSPEEFNKTFAAADAQSFECWWTIWAKPDALRQNERVFADGRSYTIDNWQPLNREITIATGKPAAVRIATFYYPHWQAIINGERVAVEPDENGAILIPVSERESKIHLVFVEPYFVRIANFLSFAVWLVFGGGLIMLVSCKLLKLDFLTRQNILKNL